jgi:hypothetical protein
MTEPREDERHTDANDETKPVTGPGGDSPDPEFGDEATIPDQNA